ncbi:MAG: MotA/TolQ/ExbB proton channel family protein [Deltaproteobacteria bacterium]|nr:MotA/TolQ/ExbB proton channel family protein [Deltaproteobacteria bacterium]
MNKTASKDFLTWILLAVSSIIVSVVVLFKFVDLTNPVSSAFLFFIAVLFFVGLFYSFKQQMLLIQEKTGQDTDQSTIAGQISNSIELLSKEHHLTSPNDYIDAYHSQTGRYIGIVSSLSSVLITLGILGTIFGLTVSLSGLKGLVSSAGNSNAIVEEMTSILAGVDLAFFTTLFGAFFGGIVLRLNLVLHEHLRSDIVASMSRKWIEICSKNSDRSGQGKIEDLLVRETDKFLNAFGEQTKKILDTLGNETKKFLANLGELTAPLKDSMGSLDEAVTKTKNSAKQLGSSLSEASGTAGSFNREMSAVSTDPLRTGLNGLSEDIDKTKVKYNEFRNAVEEVTEPLRKSMSDLTTDIAKTSEKYRELHDTFLKTTEPLKNSLENLTKDIARAGDGYKGLQNTFGDITDPLRNNLAGLSEDINNTSVGYRELKDSLNEMAGPLRKNLNEMIEDIDQTAAKYRELKNSLGEVSGPLGNSMNDLNENISKASKGVKDMNASFKELANLPVHTRLSMLVEKMDTNNEMIKKALFEQFKIS